MKKKDNSSENQAANIFQDFLISMEAKSNNVHKFGDSKTSWLEPEDYTNNHGMLIHTNLENVLQIDEKLKQSKGVTFFVLAKLVAKGKEVNGKFYEYRVSDFDSDSENESNTNSSEFILLSRDRLAYMKGSDNFYKFKVQFMSYREA